ncbi:MAG TPA: hypothetical protein VEW64_01120, partial [Methyloceanibacter sp.]|nr:hypothetical protein [Methyloceanibacter sp.]
RAQHAQSRCTPHLTSSIAQTIIVAPPAPRRDGFTYSGHPLGVAAANASLDLYRDEGLFERGLAPALIATESDIASIAERLRRVLSRLG